MSQKKRGAEDLKAAMRVTLNERKEADWMVFVLASRVAMERDKNYARANTYLTRAAELKQSPIVRLWRASLQTVSPAGAAESDPAAGIRTLDEFWTGGSEQSWHVGLYLVEAHLAQGARDPAMTTWEKVRLLMTEAQRADVGKAIDEKLGAM